MESSQSPEADDGVHGVVQEIESIFWITPTLIHGLGNHLQVSSRRSNPADIALYNCASSVFRVRIQTFPLSMVPETARSFRTSNSVLVSAQPSPKARRNSTRTNPLPPTPIAQPTVDFPNKAPASPRTLPKMYEQENQPKNFLSD